MADDFYARPEWIMGDGIQRRWAVEVASKGMVVLPTYTMSDQQAENKAPVLFTADGLLTAPDMLVTGAGKATKWNEVKAKSKPSWRRCYPGPRWEHGCDWCLAMEYQRVESASGIPVFIVIHEEHSPEDCYRESPLTGEEAWLWIALGAALQIGEHRTDWPGGKYNPRRRGKRGMGGLLWDRQRMNFVSFD